MFIDTLTEKDLDITASAQEKLYAIMNDGETGKAIRIYIAGGGCGGMTYGMGFAELSDKTDKDTVRHITIHELKKFQVFIDVVALEYLRGAQIDYITDVGMERFVFNNVFLQMGGSGSCGACGGAQ